MKTRVISGFFIAVLIVVLGILGSAPLGIALMICAVIGYQELMKACAVLKKKESGNILVTAGYIGTVLYYGALIACPFIYRDSSLTEHMDFWSGLVIAAFFLATMSIYVLTFPKFESQQVITSVFGFMYCPVLLIYVYRARVSFGVYGIFVYALIFVCSSVCDVFAYFVGRTLGRHKMAPVLSPKKTIEGAVGGVAGSTLVSWLLSLALSALYPQMHLQLEFILLGICGGLISMIGDLAASAIKRSHNIKDYGRLIPGHGGIMDRFDSIIFTAPVIYYLAVLLIGKV